MNPQQQCEHSRSLIQYKRTIDSLTQENSELKRQINILQSENRELISLRKKIESVSDPSKCKECKNSFDSYIYNMIQKITKLNDHISYLWLMIETKDRQAQELMEPVYRAKLMQVPPIMLPPEASIHISHAKEDQERIKVLEEALNKIESWLVCAGIATPEDMAQSFADMLKIVNDALKQGESDENSAG